MLSQIYDLIATTPETYGDWACNLQDRWGFLMYSSDYTIKELAIEIQETIPFIGSYLIYKIIHNIWDLLWMVCLYKLVKIMPGKM